MICGKYNTVGSKCHLEPGHEEPHTSECGATWTDESTARAAEAMKKRMTGWD